MKHSQVKKQLLKNPEVSKAYEKRLKDFYRKHGFHWLSSSATVPLESLYYQLEGESKK